MEYSLLIFLFLIQFWTVQAGDLQKYNIKVNTDCSGNTIQTVSSLTLDACDDKCLEKAGQGCKGFVYDNGNSQCILKRSCKNFQTSETRDFYTTINHICEWQPHSSCPPQFESSDLTYRGCSYEGDVSTPWCDTPSAQCSKNCDQYDLASQYGSVLTVYTRDFYDQLEADTTYQMIFVDNFGKSGLLTQINIDVGEINSELAIGIFRNTGVGTCDLTLIREISLHSHPSYQEYLQHYGVQQIQLDIRDFLAVTPYYHLGLYWGQGGTLYTTEDSRDLGYQMCGYDLQKSTHVRFVPYATQSSTGTFTRHYSLDVVLEQSDTDLNWMLNGALFRTTTIDEVTQTHEDRTLVLTDGDYTTCLTTSSGIVEIDMDTMVAIKLIKLTAIDTTFTATVKRSHDDTTSHVCGTYSGSGSLTCAEGAVGRFLTITVENEASLCEVEVILTHVAQTCIDTECYYVPSQLVDSTGAGEEECQRHYASGTLFEPHDQDHWDQVVEWYQLLSFADNFTDAAVGMKYTGGSWEMQSDSGPVPELDWGPSPESFNYAILDYTMGKPTPTSSGRPHYALCQVTKSLAEDTSKTLFRASTGSNVDLYNLWTGNSISPQVIDSFSSTLVSTDVNDSGVYKSPIIKCKLWSYIKEVRMSFYKDSTEVAYALFTPGTNLEDWFTMARMRGSSYHDLPVPVNSQANYASMFGDTRDGANRRWYLNAQTSDCENSGWLAVLDLGHESTSCDWDSLEGEDAPQFIYSNQGAYSDSWLKADVFMITGRFEQSSFGGLCIDTCKDLSDGNYQSCLGCNVYSQCESQTLTYQTCRNGLQFDSTARECLAESTTCTDGNALKSCETGCPSPDPCSYGNCLYDDDEETGLAGWVCVCDTGYAGPLCDENIDDCEEDSCGNHGDCIDLVSDFNCSCHDGYVGELCEKVDYCYLNENCLNSGVCIDGDSTYTCNCTSEYFGEHCQFEDECITQSINCTGQGECLRQESGWLCNCSHGYVGPECQFEDSCLSGVCDKIEEATCNLTINYRSYYCVCVNGKIGDTCTERNPCQSSPCLHGTCGITGSPPNNYHFNCECPGTYWSGDTCSLGPCDRSQLCEHLGTCTNVPSDPDGFMCDCLQWYEGKNCSVEKPISDPNKQVQNTEEDIGGGMSVTSIIGLVVGLLLAVAVVLVVILVIRRFSQKKVEDRRKEELEKATYKTRIRDAPASFQYWTGTGEQTYHLQNKDRYILTPHQ